MRKTIIPLIFLCFIINTECRSQIKIPIDSAKNYIGKEVQITDSIFQIKITNKAYYINFGGYYPDNTFSAVIFEIDNNVFPDRLKWRKGKLATITGVVKLYHEKPRIILTEAKQIVVN